MKKLLFFATILFMASCANNQTTPAIDLTNLDTTVAPSEDFYQYATGGWQVKNPLKPEFARYGSFDVLRENNEKRINELFAALAKTTAEAAFQDSISSAYLGFRFLYSLRAFSIASLSKSSIVASGTIFAVQSSSIISS